MNYPSSSDYPSSSSTPSPLVYSTASSRSQASTTHSQEISNIKSYINLTSTEKEYISPYAQGNNLSQLTTFDTPQSLARSASFISTTIPETAGEASMSTYSPSSQSSASYSSSTSGQQAYSLKMSSSKNLSSVSQLLFICILLPLSKMFAFIGNGTSRYTTRPSEHLL